MIQVASQKWGGVGRSGIITFIKVILYVENIFLAPQCEMMLGCLSHYSLECSKQSFLISCPLKFQNEGTGNLILSLANKNNLICRKVSKYVLLFEKVPYGYYYNQYIKYCFPGGFILIPTFDS